MLISYIIALASILVLLALKCIIGNSIENKPVKG